MKSSTKIISLLSFLTMFVIGTDTFIVAPLLPTLSSIFNIELQYSGWMVSAYALGFALLAPVAGPLSDKSDRKKVLLLGLIAFTATTSLCGMVAGFWGMIGMRFLAGVSAAFVSPQIWAAIPMLVPPEKIVKTMGAATAGLAIAQVAGIPLGSFLAYYSWRLPFFFVGLVSIILWILLFFYYPSVPGHINDKESGLFNTYKRLAKNKKLVLFLFAYLVFQTGNFEAISFYGSWFKKSFDLDLLHISIAMMFVGIGNAIGSLFGSKLVKKWGLYKSLAISILLMSGCYLLLPMAPNIRISVFGVSIIMMIAGFSFPVFMGSLQAQTEVARGTVSAMANTAMYIGTFIGGIIGSALIARTPGFYGIAYFTVVFYMLALLIYYKAGAFSHDK